MQETAPAPERAPSAEPAPPAIAFVLDPDSEGVMRRCFSDIGLVDARVQHGGIDTAIEVLGREPFPPLLIVDVSGVDDPMMHMTRLADICDPNTEVIVVGDRNDIVLYRDLKALGVAEYIFKPLVSELVTRACSGGAAGHAERRGQRTGKLIIVLGVRGGVGATTVAVSAAWHFAEIRERRVLLLDLDMQNGDAALQLDTTPSHALHEALDHTDRIDDLFLERGVMHVTARLNLFAALEPLGESVTIEDDMVLHLLTKLLYRYRYVFVDLPMYAALRLPKLLTLPSTLLLVSDGSLASARDVARWRAKIGPNSPERSTLHIFNKKGGDGALPEKEFLRAIGQPPDVVIPYDRDVPAASNIGAIAIQKCASINRAMATLSKVLAGSAGDQGAPHRPLLSRIFGSWA
jgi:pilus assembly protein CpaE